MNGKYENMNPLDKLHPGEPYFFIRSTDRFAPSAVQAYASMLGSQGDNKGARSCMEMASRIEDWQSKNPHLVKHPD